MLRRGVSLIEVMMVIGVVGLISGITLPLYRDYQIRNDLNLATEQIIQGLGRARLLSQSGKDDEGWGFYVPSGTLYKGTSYAGRDPAYDEVYPMPSTITTSGLIEVPYSKLKGIPSDTGDIILTALNEDQRTVEIEVETESVAVVLHDDLTVCHQVEGGNPHTLTIPESAWPGHQSHGDVLGSCEGESSSSSAAAASSSAASSAPGSAPASSAASAGASSSTSSLVCENRFSVEDDGTITTTGTVNVTFKALGSQITWGEGGPEIAVTVKRKRTTGNSYTDVFDGDDIDGGEQETVTGYTNGSQVVVSVRGYYRQSRWLTFDRTYYSNDETGHILALRNGDPLPDFPVFDNQGELASFMQDIISNDHIYIGTYDIVLLVELGDLDTQSADFQDAVILLQFAQPSSCN